MSDLIPLLGAKLLPHSPGPFHLVRPRLHQRLRSTLETRATLILAGPGYGKTSLVSSFLQELDGDSVWLSLDATDRDPWTLFRYLIRGLREYAPELGQRTEGVWQDLRSRPEEVERLCDLFMNEAEESLGGRLVLVLDEVQHLEASDLCTRALRRLLAYLPGTLHLILVGRSLPEVGIKALTAEGTAGLVSGEELLFTYDETRTLLLEIFGLSMRPETLERVHARTRGWVTALQLLRQTARLEAERPDLPEEVFVRTETEIFDYFTEEVLAAETPEAREFLLASALPTVIDPELCSEVLPHRDVRAILSDLLRRKLFISPLESRGGYYAYDPLFRDFLRRKFRSEKGATGQRELEVRYGRAFARRGDLPQALAHLVAAEESKEVYTLLRRHGKALLRAGILEPVREAAHLLARRGIRSAVLEDLLGEACRLSGDHAAAVGHFERALQLAARGASRLPRGFHAGARQGLAYSLLKTGDLGQAAVTANEAIAEVPADDPGLRARILNTLSIIHYRGNRLAEAATTWQEALARAREAGDEHFTHMIAHNLGLPHAALGDFRRASECFRILTRAENTHLGPEEGAAYLNLARIETLVGEPARAAALLEDAKEIAHRLRLPALTADVLEAQGTLRREAGDLEGARENYSRARALFTELGQGEVLESLAEEEAILAARAGDGDGAERLASQLVQRRRTAGDSDGLASSLLALGEIRVRAGRPASAIEPLGEAARIFKSMDRAYQECVARLYESLAGHLGGKSDLAREAAAAAFELAARYDYSATFLRVAGLDPGFRRWLRALPGAPTFLKGGAAPAKASPPPVTGGADLTVRLLGSIEVFRDEGNKIPARAWKIRRALDVFCLLTSSRDSRATKDRIVDVLWGEARPSVIEKNFHPTVSFLRRALNHGHNVPKNFIHFERGAYFLNPAYRYDVDVNRFEASLRSARVKGSRGEAVEALSEYEEALALYRGPFLEEVNDEWTEAPRSHYEALYLAALQEAGNLQVKAGDREFGIELLRKRVKHDPLSEEASADLMAALGSTGNWAGVEKEFNRLVQALSEELETDPSSATRQAYQKARDTSESPPARTEAKVVPIRKVRRRAPSVPGSR